MQEARANLSKRKASDAASPALDTAAAAAADELSPSKRIKAQAAPTDKQVGTRHTDLFLIWSCYETHLQAHPAFLFLSALWSCMSNLSSL